MGRGARIAIGITAGLALLGLIACCGWLSCLHTLGASSAESAYLEQVAPVEASLDRGETPDAALVARLAAAPVTRAFLLDLLVSRGRMDLMPPERATLEARAEADLARWLVYPTELDGEPREMRLVARAFVTSGGPELEYLVFTFGVAPDHWAADRGSMFGISGPWSPDARTTPDTVPLAGTFSELDPYSEAAARELVARMHSQVGDSAIEPAAVRIAPP